MSEFKAGDLVTWKGRAGKLISGTVRIQSVPSQKVLVWSHKNHNLYWKKPEELTRLDTRPVVVRTPRRGMVVDELVVHQLKTLLDATEGYFTTQEAVDAYAELRLLVDNYEAAQKVATRVEDT